eukprot:6213833-Pleurochrysis_carterae.AAC.2
MAGMVSRMTTEERAVLQTEAALDALGLLMQKQSLTMPTDRLTALRDACEQMASRLAPLLTEAVQAESDVPERIALLPSRAQRTRATSRPGRRRQPAGGSAANAARGAGMHSGRKGGPLCLSDAASMADAEKATSQTEEEGDEDKSDARNYPELFVMSTLKTANRTRPELEQAKSNRLQRRRATSHGNIRQSQRSGANFSAEQLAPQPVPETSVCQLEAHSDSASHPGTLKARQPVRQSRAPAIHSAVSAEDGGSAPPPASAPSTSGPRLNASSVRLRQPQAAARASRPAQRRPASGAGRTGSSRPTAAVPPAPPRGSRTPPPSDFADAEGE